MLYRQWYLSNPQFSLKTSPLYPEPILWGRQLFEEMDCRCGQIKTAAALLLSWIERGAIIVLLSRAEQNWRRERAINAKCSAAAAAEQLFHRFAWLLSIRVGVGQSYFAGKGPIAAAAAAAVIYPLLQAEIWEMEWQNQHCHYGFLFIAHSISSGECLSV